MTKTATSPTTTSVHHRSTSSRTSFSRTTSHVQSPRGVASLTHDSTTMPPFFEPRLAAPQAPTPAPKSPSPNYFGFQTNDSSLPSEGNTHAKHNWSPPSSTVRSAAAQSPTTIPLDQNPDFEAFRHQSDKAFNLTGFGNNFSHNAAHASPKISQGRPGLVTSPSKDRSRVATEARNMPPRPLSKVEGLDPATAELSQSPKRLLSPGSQTVPQPERRGSPASYPSNDSIHKSKTESPADRIPRLQLPLDRTPGRHLTKPRAETVPEVSGNEENANMMVTAQHIVTLMESAPEQMLLLDLRVSTQYAHSHITDALSLCIPTTLLKRPSFNVQKLAETFKDEPTRQKFLNWRKSKYIVVYDANSSSMKDAHTSLNTIKKFQAEGYDGIMYVIKGGFVEFAKRFPKYVEYGSQSNSSDDADRISRDEMTNSLPVIGGCPMPSTDKPANPFFGNIRQNMDLIGGVGQIALAHPHNETAAITQQYPQWLKKAARNEDQGKLVSNKFEAIERREKKRMEDALSGQVSYGTPTGENGLQKTVRIAGLEKGNKNRYNNIWPFDHSRVKLQGVPSYGCDYFNANHIKAAYSNKRYISTQAPIPATFNDFWNVIWQQDVRVIVMLTAEKEGAQVKAHNYWDARQYGQLHLDFLSEKKASLSLDAIQRHKQRPAAAKRSSTMSSVPIAPLESNSSSKEQSADQPYVTVRKFTLSHSGFPFERLREVTQLQYSSWPDFGAPAHPMHLLGLVEQCDAVVRISDRSRSSSSLTAMNPSSAAGAHAGAAPPDTRPVLVHCSAGCGRTGTFCTVDSVIDMLKRQRSAAKERASAMNGEPRTSPMDVDKAPPPASSSNSHNNGGDDGGFFANGGSSSSSATTNPQSRAATAAGAWDPDSVVAEGSWVQREDQDLVEKTVEDFRHQRLSMVQSLRQYVLCYESIMEWLSLDTTSTTTSSATASAVDGKGN